MGHYDSCYEHDAEKHYNEMKDDAEDRITRTLYSMSLDNMRLLADIAENIESFVAVFQIISKQKRS